MIGVSENFPKKIHRLERFETKLASKKIQKKLIQILESNNRKTYSFEDITYPSVPNCKIIFEAGLAEAKTFNYIDEEEKNRFLKALKKETLNLLDLFFSIRYYRINKKKDTPLNFDYYMIRIIFHNKTIEVKVFHERGPRHISPEEIVTFIINELNKNSTKKISKLKTKKN
jgi:hypothetical protein